MPCRSARAALGLASLALLSACQSSMSAQAQMSADLNEAKAEARTDVDQAESDQPVTRQESTLAFAEAGDSLPLLGARRNVKVKSKDGAVACRCVSVLLGPASMSQLEWEGAMPMTKPETQLVVALIPEAGECPGAAKASRGPSYWGYRVQGSDVVVFLEDLKPKPPQTLAAIIPKPPAGGQVFVSPVERSVPYGAPLDGNGRRCAVGNPGPKRETSLTDEEIGSSRPSSESEPVAE